MALWQYSFIILPKKASQIPIFYKTFEGDLNLFDSDVYWRNENFPCANFSEVEVVLPKTKSWNEKLVVYGDVDSTDLRVYCDNGVILSVVLRIDFTKDYEFLLRTLIDFFIRQELILLDSEFREVALNYESIRQTIQSSSQLEAYRKLAEN